MKDEVIELKFQEHKDRLDKHDKKFENQDNKILKIEQDNIENKINIKNLCDNLKSLTTALWGLVSVLITGVAMLIITKVL